MTDIIQQVLEDRKQLHIKAISQAQEEVRQERFRALVEKEKIRLRNRPPRWWHAFVPFTITITIKRRQT